MSRKTQILAFAIVIIMFAVLQVQLFFVARRAEGNDYSIQLQEQAQAIDALQAEVLDAQLRATDSNGCDAAIAEFWEELSQVLEASPPFGHGLTAAQVKEALMQAEDDLLTAEIFGRAPSFVGTEAMEINEGTVTARVVEGFFDREEYLLLGYEVIGQRQPPHIVWTLLATSDINMHPRYFQPNPPRSITSEESVAIRFYYYCDETDPYFNLFPEAYLYNIVEIPGPYLREEFRRLMLEHTGINVWDLWFQGNKLYIDLHSTEWHPFNWGTTGSAHRGNVLTMTLASFPGIDSFEVLVGGARGVHTSHYSFDWVAIVEDGEIVRFEDF